MREVFDSDRHGGCLALRGLGVGSWEVNDKVTSAADFGMCFKPPSMFFDDAASGGQTEACAAGAMREVGVKDL